MEIFDRFANRWDEWDARVMNTEQANAFLRAAKDEDLLELLAGGSTKDRKYERDIVTTEIQNRLATRNRDHPLGADEVLDAARVAYEAAANGQKAIHTAEAILKASGDLELGTSVSAAAFVSLDTTKVALDAARAHAAELQAALAQSRVASGFSKTLRKPRWRSSRRRPRGRSASQSLATSRKRRPRRRRPS